MNTLVDYIAIRKEQADNSQNFRTGEFMICGLRYSSLKKGRECRSYESCDVVSTDSKGVTARKGQRYADCGCFYDNTGYPRCGIMNGDKEFENYREAFRIHKEKSLYCHVARDFEYECGDPQAYYNL